VSSPRGENVKQSWWPWSTTVSHDFVILLSHLFCCLGIASVSYVALPNVKNSFKFRNLTKVLLAWVNGKVIRELLCAFYMHLGHDWFRYLDCHICFLYTFCRMTYFHCQLFASFFVLLQFPHWLFGFSAAWALLIAVGFISYIFTKSILIISTMGTHVWKNFHQLSQAWRRENFTGSRPRDLGLLWCECSSMAYLLLWFHGRY
jgi:hypothetical protein